MRRSSDSAEQDVGFSGADLDTTSLLSFVGGGSGYVTKMYNQVSGASVDFTQSDTSKQPIICASGSVNLFKVGGKPAPIYSDPVWMGATISIGTTNNIGVSGVVNTSGTPGYDTRLVSYQATGASTDWNDIGSFEIETKDSTSSGGTLHAYRANSGASVTATYPCQYAVFTSSTNQRIDITLNGGSDNSSGASGQGNFGSGGLLLMGTVATTGWNGPMPELIFQATYNSTDLTAIAADQKTYWGTP